MVERNAYIAGCSGVATVKSAEVLGIEPSGTIPHALIILMGDSVAATMAFDEIIDPSVPRVALVDTFGDEKFESLAVAEAMGGKLAAVRLDTTSSRRGNFLRILQEVRWELDLRGWEDVKLIASGGINEKSIVNLNQIVDAYGIGTAISGGPTVDFSLDIIEIEGAPIAKRGKMSGSKELFRCRECLTDHILSRGSDPPVCSLCGGKTGPLLVTYMEKGKLTVPYPDAEIIRSEVIKYLEGLDVEPS
jgi:nicotinate phosphoribosyltransferase